MSSAGDHLTILACTWFLMTLTCKSLLAISLRSTNSSGEAGGGHCAYDISKRSFSCANLTLTSIPEEIPSDVLSIDLSANEIRVIDDVAFYRFTEILNLNVGRNLLSYVSSDSFKRNTKLLRLMLDDNDLDTDFLKAVSTLNSLQELRLARNRITDTDQLSKISSLLTLDLSENEIDSLSSTILEDLPSLSRLNAASNRLKRCFLNVTFAPVQLEELNLSSNFIINFSISGLLPNLRVLDLSGNRLSNVERNWFLSFPLLEVFVVSGNPIAFIPDSAFSPSPYLERIEMNFLRNLTSINDNIFGSSHRLKYLEISHNPPLDSVQWAAFRNLTQLTTLDLSFNALSTLDLEILGSLVMLETLDLNGNPWLCDCQMLEHFSALRDVHTNGSVILSIEFICSNFPLIVDRYVTDLYASNITVGDLDCKTPKIYSSARKARHQLGSSAILDCVVMGNPMPQIVWVTNRNVTLRYVNTSDEYDITMSSMTSSSMEGSRSYFHHYERVSHFFVLKNGSLHIAYVTRKDAGFYRCLALNGTVVVDTIVVEFCLDYEVMSVVAVTSIIVGFLTAAGFFLIAVVIGIVRYFTFVCSEKEKAKRKSIRQVLDAIQDYKSAQIDKLSAYKTAKMDQLSAFKSAKIDQFSAFGHARIGRIRTYKQATVTNVLQHLERMREHYANQTVRIKDNCAQQMDKLRDSYSIQRGKFKDYRSYQAEKIRDNYNAQVLKVREYSVQQMLRLREQYKAQQQNVLKLLELLDIGNCVTVIEAECMHTESVIFDASIVFDFEAHSIHVPRDSDSNLSDESHYLTAGESESSSIDSPRSQLKSCVIDVEPTSSRLSTEDVDDGTSDSDNDIYLESLQLDAVDDSSFSASNTMDDARNNVGTRESDMETEC